MGGNRSQGSSEGAEPLGSLSFVPALLGNAFFGSGINLHDGGFQNVPGTFGNVQPGSPDSLLDPNSLVSNLTDLVNPGINPAISSGGVDILQQLGQLGGVAGSNLLLGPGLDTFQEGLQTGFKPDLQPVIDQASRAFFNEIVPQLGQSNVALQEGVGPFSTDLSGQLVKAGSGLATNLGALETQLQNDAGQRRAELAALSGTFAGNLSGVPQGAASGALQLGEEQVLAGTLGGRQAQLLQLLAGLQPGGTGVRGAAEQEQSSKGGGVFSG